MARSLIIQQNIEDEGLASQSTQGNETELRLSGRLEYQSSS
jgi:hypothetical protein